MASLDPKYQTRNRAFTLIELLVVIAIIAILAAILFPVFAQAKQAAKKTQLISNMKQLGTGMTLYINDNDGGYPEMVSGGCTGRAAQVNRLWTSAIYVYVKSKEVYQDPSADLRWTGFRFDSSVAGPDGNANVLNPPPCGDTNTDRRAQSIGLNRAFFSYFQCDPTAQIGCTNVGWDPGTDAGCASQMINEGRISESSNFVTLGNTSVKCAAGAQGYALSSPPAINLIDGMSSRAGEGVVMGFADTHARFYPASADPAIITAGGGNKTLRFSPVQNRKATTLRTQGQGNAVNGVLNCVNFNGANLTWNPWAARPGENAAVDTLCK